MSGTRATLGGYPLLGRTPVAWDLIDGSQPHRAVFELLDVDAQALIGAQPVNPSEGRPEGVGVELVVDVAGGASRTVRRLYPTQIAPSDHLNVLCVLVEDRRRWWNYHHIARAYNVRRRTARTRRLEQEDNLVELQPLAVDVLYAPWSLKDAFTSASPSTPFAALDVLIDVLDVLAPGEYRIDELKRDVPIEGLQLDDPGGDALDRALSFLAGAAVSVADDGFVVVRDSRDGQEAAVAAAMLPPIPGGPLAVFASHRVTRPSKVRVLFTRELELRYDSPAEQSTAEVAAAATSTVSPGAFPGPDSRTCANVAPVPDAVLTFADGRQVFQGSWVKLDDLFLAWAKNPVAGQGWDITADNVRQGYFSPGLLSALTQGLGLEDSAILSTRLACALQHWRRTYQLDRRHVDRLQSIRAVRSAILDPVTGIRAPARAYMDWAEWYSMRGVVPPGGKPPDFRLFQAFRGYAASLKPAGGGPPQAAPFRVSIVDEDLGIFHVEPIEDPFGRVLARSPGLVQGPGGGDPPSGDPRDSQSTGKTVLRGQAQLATGFQLATVLTVVPGAPNVEARFYVVEVKPSDFRKAVPRGSGFQDFGAPEDFGGDDASGPPIDVRIGQSFLTARFAWLDELAADVDAALGIPGGDPKKLKPINEADLEAVALAAAAQVYAGEQDQVEGGLQSAFNPTIRPLGNATHVSHALLPDGTALTSVSFPHGKQPVDLVAYLKESTRRRILGLVDQRGYHA